MFVPTPTRPLGRLLASGAKKMPSAGADFSSASSDFKVLGAFFCNFPKPKSGRSRGSSAGAAHGRPRDRAPDVVGSRLPRPYHLRARIQSYQAVAAPFLGDSALPSSPLGPRSHDRNAPVQKIVERLAGWDSFPIWEFSSLCRADDFQSRRNAIPSSAQPPARRRLAARERARAVARGLSQRSERCRRWSCVGSTTRRGDGSIRRPSMSSFYQKDKSRKIAAGCSERIRRRTDNSLTENFCNKKVHCHRNPRRPPGSESRATSGSPRTDIPDATRRCGASARGLGRTPTCVGNRRSPADVQDLGLADNGRGCGRSRFALSMPALMSAPSKKSFSSASSPILA
jgi:hypothetical protein